MWVNSCSTPRESIVPPSFLKLPSKLVSEVSQLTQRDCFHTPVNALLLPLWWAGVKKKLPPSSPTLLLLAENRMIKARVSHQNNCNNTTVPSKGGDATMWDDRVLIWTCCLLSVWDQRRPGGCVAALLWRFWPVRWKRSVTLCRVSLSLLLLLIYHKTDDWCVQPIGSLMSGLISCCLNDHTLAISFSTIEKYKNGYISVNFAVL